MEFGCRQGPRLYIHLSCSTCHSNERFSLYVTPISHHPRISTLQEDHHHHHHHHPSREADRLGSQDLLVRKDLTTALLMQQPPLIYSVVTDRQYGSIASRSQ